MLRILNSRLILLLFSLPVSSFNSSTVSNLRYFQILLQFPHHYLLGFIQTSHFWWEPMSKLSYSLLLLITNTLHNLVCNLFLYSSHSFTCSKFYLNIFFYNSSHNYKIPSRLLSDGRSTKETNTSPTNCCT